MKTTLLAFVLLLVSTGIRAQHRLTLTITNLKQATGTVYVTLFSKAEGFPGEAENALRKASVKATGATVTVVLDNLPAGDYAVSTYHDANNNGKLDQNFMGIPKERYGASNDATRALGPPKWDEARFRLNGSQAMNIRLE